MNILSRISLVEREREKERERERERERFLKYIEQNYVIFSFLSFLT